VNKCEDFDIHVNVALNYNGLDNRLLQAFSELGCRAKNGAQEKHREGRHHHSKPPSLPLVFFFSAIFSCCTQLTEHQKEACNV